MTDPAHALEQWYADLARGAADPLAARFAGEARVDTPMRGAVAGRPAFDRYVAAEREWIESVGARIETVATIAHADRIVVEQVLALRAAGQAVELPVALVADRAPGDARGRLQAVRIYYSTWPLTGSHAVRAPLLAPAAHLEEPPIVERYMHALAAGDKAAILATFTADGYVREPSGAQYKHAGEAGRRRFYDMALASGGVSLKHCTAVFDGRRFAVEYVCDAWGGTKLPPQAGMAVYELAGAGAIAAVRIYDDVSPPGEGH